MSRAVSAFIWILTLSASVNAQTALTVVNAGPQGEVASLAEANEIRIVFSEPMVSLGRIPAEVTAPFVRISPAIPGTFRWSGTTILIFTPDPKRPLPYATTYEVRVDATAAALSGRRLAKPMTFRFTTPTVRLLETRWYRRDGTVHSPMVVLLRFNQPVRQTDIAAALSVRLVPHHWAAPGFTPESLARIKSTAPAALDAYHARVETVRRIAASDAPVQLRPTSEWDRRRYPASPDLVAFEARHVEPESHVRLTIAPDVRSPAGSARPGTAQEFTIEAEPAFFVDGPSCSSQCDGDYRNAIQMRQGIRPADFAPSVSVLDLGAGGKPVPKKAAPLRVRDDLDWLTTPTLEDAGYDPQPPNSRYAITISPDLKAVDGQTLGYTWIGVIDNWHMRAFTSFGDGHGVWEKDGGTRLPFYARNIAAVTQFAAPIRPSELMPLLMRLQERHFAETPSGPGTSRRLGGTPDRIQSHGLDLSSALRPGGTGLVWTSVREGDPISRSRYYDDSERARTKSSVVQVTNLGITVKDSPQNTFVLVTRLDNGEPVANARVSIVRTDNSTFWQGTTAADGTVVAPETPLRDPNNFWKFAFVVTAEKDGDVAYVGSDWNEGISPWDFGTGVNLRQAVPLLRGSVFTDRGVYRLGEEVHLKAILRHNTPAGIRLLPAETPVFVIIRDAQDRIIDQRTVRVNDWSSAEWTMTLPKEGTLGNHSLQAILESDRTKPRPYDERASDRTAHDDRWIDWEKSVHGSFLVAAYRRPDFRVDVTLTGGMPIAGDRLTGAISARYLFGAGMGTRPVRWTFSRSASYRAPEAIVERFPSDRWVFAGWVELDDHAPSSSALRSEETKLSREGELTLQLDTPRDAGRPYEYQFEADVEDVSRQHIANRGSITVHPAPFYIGVRRPASYFLDQKAGFRTEVSAAAIDGSTVAGVPVEVTLTRIQWTSVRRAAGNGRYTWESERKLVPAGKWSLTTAAEPVPVDLTFESGGFFVLEAVGRDAEGRRSITRTSLYVIGEGYTAWRRFDHNRIELTPERRTYSPGETARIMIQSPWERATALVTTEREGIRSHRRFVLTSTQQSVSIPITEADIPNVFVSIVLIKGRTAAPASTVDVAAKSESDPADPGKPAFRMGYVELAVEDHSKRLSVTVAANQQEYRPASAANVRLEVKDQQGRGVASEVTLWAVDHGVLSLTSYRPPDVAGSVYVRKALQVFNADSRQRIVSRRVLTPKGETEGGGGGAALGAGTLRKDFRVLAFWVGSVTTDANGRASVDVRLPESLTTYRIMAVAGDRASRFGSGNAEVRTNKPLTLKPTFPRFLTIGDRAYFGAVVGSQLPVGGEATVTMKSLDPGVLEFAGPAEQRITLNAGGTIEVRFESVARAVGSARVQMAVKLAGESDAFEDVIRVDVLTSPETVAAYGEASAEAPIAAEALDVPAGVLPGVGGLRVELASTALVGLGEGARYLVEYPYGCAEQKASRALALLLAADLGDAFSLPGVDTAKMKPAVQQTLRELETFQCPNGGFAYWPGNCLSVSAYLTSYVLHVFRVASDLGYEVTRSVRERAYTYLEQQLATPPPVNEGWWPSYTAWQAFAIKVLVEGGRNQDSNINRIYGYRDRMPVFALAYLHDALLAKKETTGERVDELLRRIANAILPEAGSAHVDELSDPYLLWFWNSNVRSTAIVLNSFVARSRADGSRQLSEIRPLVRGLMNARTNGRWGNTQENAHAMEALVNYYRRFEPEAPSFRAIVTLGQQELMREQFEGRSVESTTREVPLAELTRTPGRTQPLTFAREGAGTLFYATRLRYATDAPAYQPLDSGFHIERRYEPFVEKGTKPASTSFQAGDLVRVILTFTLTKERRFVAVTDPLPAGFEALESWFATTARDLASQQDQQRFVDGAPGETEWESWWRRGGFDHVERHDDRVQLFATRLSEGVHEFTYVVRATTAGTFRTAPARAEEMYTPDVFGRTASTTIEVKR